MESGKGGIGIERKPHKKFIYILEKLFQIIISIDIWTVQSSYNLLILLESQIVCRHSGESRNPEYYQYDMTSGCRIKSGMTKEL